MRALLLLCLTLAGCTPLPACPDCPRAPTQAERVICVDEAFGADTAAVRHAVERWDAALCGVVHVTSRVVDPLTEPCSLTVLRVDPSWQWVQSRPRDALAWTDTDRGIAWVLTPARDIESIAAHEIGHLLGADHATLTRYPQQCVSHGSAVQSAYHAGRDSAERTTP
jgi:hypothetical protein